MGEPTLIDDGGNICPNCNKKLPCIQYGDSGNKEDLPCRNCNNREFMESFRALFNKVVDNK
ncbi:MAG: hypothetical protein ACFFAN_16395 [Promethearchaeota archaeon]